MFVIILIVSICILLSTVGLLISMKRRVDDMFSKAITKDEITKVIKLLDEI